MHGTFVLRVEHEDAFGSAGLARFELKAQNLLRKRHTQLVAPINDADLRFFVRRWIDLARGHGLRTERQMFAVCEAGAVLRQKRIDVASDFEVVEILAGRNPPDEIAAAVREYAFMTVGQT